MDVFGSVRSILKLDSVCIDNNVFRLHYKATVIFLLAFSFLVTSRQYFGNPIECIQRDDIPQRVIDTYCWIHATFTLPNSLFKKTGHEVVYPGVEKYTPGDQTTYHKYYQWVCWVLFLQALSFYTPRYLWKIWENGRLRSLVLGLNSPIVDSAEKEKSMKVLVQYMKLNIRYHNSYFYRFAICEALNLVNCIIQIYLIDAFLGGSFSSYGWDVLKQSELAMESRDDPLTRIFPKLTKCTFHRFGSSGDVQRHDALCLLPLNIINEKVYIFLWFWLVFLAILSGIMVIYRVAISSFAQFRYVTLRSRARFTDRYHLRTILDMSGIGDWFLLYLLCKNLDPLHFRELMQELYKELNDEGKSLIDKAKYTENNETAFNNANAPE